MRVLRPAFALALAGVCFSQPSPPGEPKRAAQLAAPRLLSPAANAAVPEPVLFEWTEIRGAAAYTFQIHRSPTFDEPVRSEKVNEPRIAVNAPGPGPLWWRVRAIDSSDVPGRWSAPRRITPLAPPPAAAVAAVTLTPATVPGGHSSEGLVSLADPAPAGGASIGLSSSDTSVATVPHHVVVTEGSRTASFLVETMPVPENRPVRISAVSRETARSAALTVAPRRPPAFLASLAIHPATLAGGNTTQGTVRLTDAAPAPGGVVIHLASDDPALAEVPPEIRVPAGQRAAVFAVRTGRVTLSKPVMVTAALEGVERKVALRLTGSVPAGPLSAPVPELPADRERLAGAGPILFRWTAVIGAASYTLEVDRSTTFASPALITRTVPDCEVRVGPFVRQTFWWRVRANDLYGIPGNWSVPRALGED